MATVTQEERTKEKAKIWRAAHMERVLEINRRSRENNPIVKDISNPRFITDRLRQYRRHCKVRGKGHVIQLDKETFAAILATPCIWCQKTHGLGIDRIDREKTYEIGNVLPACGECNLNRGPHPIPTYLKYLGRKGKDVEEIKKRLSAWGAWKESEEVGDR